MKKSIAIITATVALTSVALPSQPGMAARSAASSPREGGTLIAAAAADAVLFDQANTNDNPSIWAQQLVEGNLVRITADGKGFVPDIAQSWQISNGGRTYIFHLNPQARFCNGQQITSADVIYSYGRASAKNSGVSWQFPGLVSVSAQGPETVIVKLSQPSPAFLSYVTLWGTAISSKAYGQKVGTAGLTTKPLGSGAFCLASWQKGQETDFTRNPYYWLKDAQGNRLPYLDAIKLKIIPDDNARILALESGQVQAVAEVPPAQFNALRGVAHVVTGESFLLGASVLVMNVRKPYFADLHIRQAMNYAVDKESIVKAVLFGHGQPAMDPVDLMNWHTSKYGYPFNLAKAQQLMAQSKYPHGFSCSVIYNSGDTQTAETLVIVKADLAKIGITLNIKPLDSGTANNEETSHNFDMWQGLGTGDIFDPSENLPFEMLPTANGGQDAGYSGWSNSTVTKLILEAVQEMDVNKRIADYDTIQRIFMQTGPSIWLYNPQNLWASRDNVHGFSLYQTARRSFDTTWISQ